MAIHKTSELLGGSGVAEAVQRPRKRLPDANIQIHIPEDFILIPSGCHIN